MKKLIMLVVVMAITVGSTFVPSNKSSQVNAKKWFEFIRVYNGTNSDGSARCGLGRGLCNF
ncbi:hypothetical protein [Marivirga sp.]|uniref:hypothetical protein n=1 Tax=Marivirga sp. TaxID=2018662 RepID=UPI002D7E3596|nr:hypothetical protein [Marivirga sp.]HET8861339.1 hypothetical protein [Marivirga sp.]